MSFPRASGAICGASGAVQRDAARQVEALLQNGEQRRGCFSGKRRAWLQFWLQWPFCLCCATALGYRKELEARAGIEPAHKGFADLSLTTWVPRLGLGFEPESSHSANHLVDFCRGGAEWSGRRDLNSRPSPWQGDALPLSYSRLTQIRVYRAAESGSNRQPTPRNGLCPPNLDACRGSSMRSARPPIAVKFENRIIMRFGPVAKAPSNR